ncbi:MAG: 2-dehydropantoate 2-reductase [Deltaproteobacteria bacterium]|nr:2-dehydropantoate 2-reductase [Deltaproteobacteria bacterium]
MRYVILGAGAVGGVIGAKLFRQGSDVVLLARGPHLAALRDRGLTLETPQGSERLAIPACGHPSELRFGPGDVVLLATKSQHSEAALAGLLAAAGPDVPVVCAQNGVANERLAARQFRSVYGMLVLMPATHLQPGVVQAHCAPVAGALDVGCWPAGTDERGQQLVADLAAAGFSARVRSDIMRWKYAKLLSNLGNALQALCGLDGDAHAFLEAVHAEARAVLTAAGIAWATEAELGERLQALSPMGTIHGSARGGGSSWQSLARGTGNIEADFLNGEIVALGRTYGVATPLNAALQRLAVQTAERRRPPGALSLADVLAAAEVADPHHTR